MIDPQLLCGSLHPLVCGLVYLAAAEVVAVVALVALVAGFFWLMWRKWPR